MAITISSAFDAGNIRVVKQDGDRVDLEIVKDHLSDFYQWFYFRVAGAAGREVTLADHQLRRLRLSQWLARLPSRACRSTARNGCASPTRATPTAS